MAGEADLQGLLSLLHVSRVWVGVEHLHGTHPQLSHQVDPHMRHSSLVTGFMVFKATQAVQASLHTEEVDVFERSLIGSQGPGRYLQADDSRHLLLQIGAFHKALERLQV